MSRKLPAPPPPPPLPVSGSEMEMPKYYEKDFTANFADLSKLPVKGSTLEDIYTKPNVKQIF